MNSLEVVVYSARNVAITNKIPDCMCVIKCGKQKFGTGVCSNTNTPKWDTTTKFDNVKTGTHFTVTLQSSKKKFLGKVKVPFEKLLADPQCATWLPLKGKNGKDSSKVTGQLHLRWIYRPGGNVSTTVGQAPAADPTPVAEKQVDFAAVHKQNQEDLLGKPAAKQDTSSSLFTRLWSSNTTEPVENDLSTTEGVIAQTEAIRGQSVASTQRTLKTLDQSIVTGTTTLDKLHHQGQQLKNMSYDMDSMDGKLAEGSRNLRGVESIWGAAANKFTKNKKKDLANRPDRSKTLPSSSTIKDSRPDLTDMKINNRMRSQTVDRDSSQIDEQEPDEVDRNLEEIGRRVGILKELALDFSTEIEDQSATMEKLEDQVERNNIEIKRQSAWVRKLL